MLLITKNDRLQMKGGKTTEMLEEQQVKLRRIRGYLRRNGYTGMVLARSDNFSWLSAGGSNRVVVPKEEGYGIFVVTPDSFYMIAQVMDGLRIMEEELAGMDVEYVPLRWFEESILDRAIQIAGRNPVLDVAAGSFAERLCDIYDLHFPLTEWEMERLEEAGRMSDEILTRTAKEIKPGMKDYEVEAMLLYEYALHNIQCDVLLIGTDDRIFKYRHPNPAGRELGRYVLLHPAVRYRGLHCNVTRSVYFGDKLPEEIRRPYEAASQIEAYCLAQCMKGRTYAEILEGQKALLHEYGYSEEWKNHYPGGRTGYFVCQAGLSREKDRRTTENEAYDWFITITGAKVEELSVNRCGRIEILSHKGKWPSKQVFTEGETYQIPQIMMG